MKGMIMAAGLGTRLRPLTDNTPKALVKVGGVPMLERILTRMREFGFDYVVVNVHHLGEQVIDYLAKRESSVVTVVSDERDLLMDTGGGLEKAMPLLGIDREPVLVHNVDILSNADLGELTRFHKSSGNDITLLVSDRDSSRRLLFDKENRMRGWHNLATGVYRPGDDVADFGYRELAFSGIYVVDMGIRERLEEYGPGKPFGIMDFMLDNLDSLKIGGFYKDDLRLIDIGKPATLSQADKIFQL